MAYPHFTVAAAKTISNMCLYVLSGRRSLLLEGRRKRGTYRNWSGDRRHRADWHEPETEEAVAEVIRRSTSVRVVGSGHSFNDGLATTDATISLEHLSGVVSIDHQLRQATVWAGTRLRDLTPVLLKEGLAFRSLASHDAQSVAGILSTDVHGTGRLPAHLSDQVVSLRLVDGTGAVSEVGPDDDLFKAAVGGLGSVGVITQVTVQCVDAFNLRQASGVKSRRWAEKHLEQLLSQHDHVSFYAYPFTDLLHVHTWDHTDDRRSFLGARREAMNEAKAAVAAATFGDAMAHFGKLPKTADRAMRMQAPSSRVLHSHEAFSRSQYHLHQELEIAVPHERVWTELDQTLHLYEEMYRQRRLPFLLVEVRFSPAGHDRSFLGAGAERATAWLCLCCNQSGAVDEYFESVEQWLGEADARVHLGKWCETLDADDVAAMHGDRFKRFAEVRDEADPKGRFVNPFIERVLGPLRSRVDGPQRSREEV
ncbi:MAG: D-arabinono-1,4-lactone oxidase [Acidimicrobiales bacterium]